MHEPRVGQDRANIRKHVQNDIDPGENHAALHNPDYDFPDDLIPIGAAIFEQIARDLLG